MTVGTRLAEPPASRRRRIAPDLLEALADAFGQEFTVFDGLDEGAILERLGGGRPPAPAASRTQEVWGTAGSGPAAIALDDQRCLAVVPVRSRHGRTLRAAAVVACGDPGLTLRLARTAVRNVRLKRKLRRRRKELTAYADRVSRDFEELWWLRKLAENLEYCEVTSGPETVAATLLPSLREIIEAEAVALISGEGPQSGPLGGTTPHEWSWAGSRNITEDACRRIVEEFGSAPGHGAVVRNDLPGHPDLAAAGVASFILVPVAKGSSCFGWLLALNKTADADAPAGGHTAGLSEPEFGSFEAGLLSAAAVMLAAHARNAELFRQRELLLIGVIRTLVNAIDAKDAYTCGHSDRVARIAMRLAEELGLDHASCLQVYMTGLLHDVGKIGVPDAILCKPGKLTDEEFSVVKRHPAIGYQILKHLNQLSYVLPGVLHHHETVSGTGYPHGLAGEAIPLQARILAVADSYDAMTSSRPYREAMPFERAEQIIREGSGRQWDAEVVAALFRALDDIHAICIDCDSRQHTLDAPTGDGLELPAEAFADQPAARAGVRPAR